MLRLALLLWGIGMSGLCVAHEMRPALLELTELPSGQYEVLWKVPARGGMALSIAPRLPSGCRDVSEPKVLAVPGAFIERWMVDCGSEGLAGKRIGIAGLESKRSDVLVVHRAMSGQVLSTLLKPDEPWLEMGKEPSALETARRYTVLGVEHILLGIDHLLFVLGLLLIVRGARLRIKTITAFTVAHSITLAGASLGILRVPQGPVEAVIALSILFLATELARGDQDGEGLTRRFPWVAAFAFGLLHGFGFAGALSELGLPRGDIPLALFTFNVGVELGQILFVFAVSAVAWAGRGLLRASSAWAPRVAAYGIGSVSSFWLLERLPSF